MNRTSFCLGSRDVFVFLFYFGFFFRSYQVRQGIVYSFCIDKKLFNMKKVVACKAACMDSPGVLIFTTGSPFLGSTCSKNISGFALITVFFFNYS